jgi:multicomponent Na+:H+ antiporter subunit D
VAEGMYWVLGVLVASTLLNAAYFLPVIKRIWLHPAPAQWPKEADASRLEVYGMIGSALVAAALALGVGIFAGHPLSPLNWARGIVAGYFP